MESDNREVGGGEGSAETATKQRTHLLTADVDRYGDLRFSIRCPYTEYSEDRPCRMGLEPQPACGQWMDDGECDIGGFASDVGHVHPVDDCWVQWTIAEFGWEDCISWVGERPTSVSLPIEVEVFPDADGLIEIRALDSGSSPNDHPRT